MTSAVQRNTVPTPKLYRGMRVTSAVLISLLAVLMGGCARSNAARPEPGSTIVGTVPSGLPSQLNDPRNPAGNPAFDARRSLGALGKGERRVSDLERVATVSLDRRQLSGEPPPLPSTNPRHFKPARPAREAVWLEGHWSYTGNPQTPYEWMSGHWEIPPPGAQTWMPSTWEKSADGYIYVRGHWR